MSAMGRKQMFRVSLRQMSAMGWLADHQLYFSVLTKRHRKHILWFVH